MDMASALLCVQDGRCFYCSVEFDGPVGKGRWRPKAWTREHVYPKRGGYTLENNCVLSCAKCNRNKGAREPGKNEVSRAYVIMQKAVRLARIANGELPQGWSLDRTVTDVPSVQSIDGAPPPRWWPKWLARFVGGWCYE